MPLKDDFGDRMKQFERRETDRSFLPYLPVYARIDGRSFSRFTKGLDRPFDAKLADVMQETMRRMVADTHAKIGYTQSDEISLIWTTEERDEELLFAGKVQKLCSVLAGMASSLFVTECVRSGGELAIRAMDKAPHFDARVFQLPTRGEAVNALIWREKDAAKNAVSMAARCHFSHKALQGKRSGEMREMLADKGVDFTSYPMRFRRGVYVQTRPVMVEISDEQRERIPEKHRPIEGSMVRRSVTDVVDLTNLAKIVNREDVVFAGAEPVMPPL